MKVPVTGKLVSVATALTAVTCAVRKSPSLSAVRSFGHCSFRSSSLNHSLTTPTNARLLLHVSASFTPSSGNLMPKFFDLLKHNASYFYNLL